MKKLLAIVLSATMMLAVTACGGTATPSAPPVAPPPATGSDTTDPTPPPVVEPPAGDVTIGVAMPTKSLQRWNQDGDNMKAKLEAAGYKVDLQYANNEVATQVSQIENMVTAGCKVLVIAAIDASSLTTVLDNAKAQGVQVIAYDRLILDTDAVTYYATFDNVMVGTIQGKFLEEKLGLASGAGPFNIELITGDPGDTNAGYFFQGAMAVLQPYIDSGKLVVPSGQTSFEQCATADWNTENAQARFENIITAYYASGAKLDAVMASNDSTAQGVTNALLAAGFTKDNFPLITGQDCDITSVKNMLAGTQAMSIFKDTRTLAAKAVEMVDAIVKGTTVDINDTSTYNNNKGIVPSFLCEPVFGTVDNYKELLIDSGYYTEDQLQ